MRTGLMAVAGMLLAGAALAGCGIGSGEGTTGAATPSPVVSTAAPTAPAVPPSASPSSPTGGTSANGSVPPGFAATSATFVSRDEGFVLGTAPCARKPCTSILRTLDRGKSWHGLPAPAVPVGQPGDSEAASGIRFASPSHGFVFGTALWETRDGGQHWSRVSGAPGDISSLEISDGQVLALSDLCSAQGYCSDGVLMRRPVNGGAWKKVATLRPTPRPIATQYGVAAVMSGPSVVVTRNGGLSQATRATPCNGEKYVGGRAAEVAVTGPGSLAVVCASQGGTQSMDKTVFVSGDLGAHWTPAGTAPPGGDISGAAGGTASRLVVAASFGVTDLYYSANRGRTWRTSYSAGNISAAFADLGFTTASDGIAVSAPAYEDGHGSSADNPGQLLLTSDGGATWHPVTW